MESMTTTNKIVAIPDELLVCCFTFLSVSSLGNVQSTCRRWNTILNTSHGTDDETTDSWFWKRTYELRFRHRDLLEKEGQIEPTIRCNWKSRYRHRSIRDWCDPKSYSTDCRSSSTPSTTTDQPTPLMFSNSSSMPSMYGGYGQSIRTQNSPPEHGGGWRYFEATVWGMGSVGLVSISTVTDRGLYGARSQLHVGWRGFSYGYHNDDGHVYVPDDGPATTRWNMDIIRHNLSDVKLRYGPSWGKHGASVTTDGDKDPSSVVGCGYQSDTQEFFYTLDGRFLGIVPRKLQPKMTYAAAVTLHDPNDRVMLNAGVFPFRFDIDRFCLGSRDEVEAGGGREN